MHLRMLQLFQNVQYTLSMLLANLNYYHNFFYFFQTKKSWYASALTILLKYMSSFEECWSVGYITSAKKKIVCKIKQKKINQRNKSLCVLAYFVEDKKRDPLFTYWKFATTNLDDVKITKEFFNGFLNINIYILQTLQDIFSKSWVLLGFSLFVRFGLVIFFLL